MTTPLFISATKKSSRQCVRLQAQCPATNAIACGSFEEAPPPQGYSQVCDRVARFAVTWHFPSHSETRYYCRNCVARMFRLWNMCTWEWLGRSCWNPRARVEIAVLEEKVRYGEARACS
jgi:hypothetical protein